MNIIIFGAGASGRMLYDEVKGKDRVIAFTDNDPNKWGKTICGVPVYEPQKCLLSMEYDVIIVGAFCGLNDIRKSVMMRAFCYLVSGIKSANDQVDNGSIIAGPYLPYTAFQERVC